MKRVEAGPDAVEIKPSMIPNAVTIKVVSPDGCVTLRRAELEDVIRAMHEAVKESNLEEA